MLLPTFDDTPPASDRGTGRRRSLPRRPPRLRELLERLRERLRDRLPLPPPGRAERARREVRRFFAERRQQQRSALERWR